MGIYTKQKKLKVIPVVWNFFFLGIWKDSRTERGTVLRIECSNIMFSKIRTFFGLMLVLALHQNPAKQHQHNCCNKNTATRNKNTAARNKNTAAARNKNTAATLNKNTATRNNYYSKINNTDKMNDISRTIKINFEGSSREVSLSTPATLAGLQAAVASAFGVKLAARSRAAGVADTDLSFTYMDSDGDDIVFDKDSELRLALRLCPSPLEISAASKQQVKVRDAPP